MSAVLGVSLRVPKSVLDEVEKNRIKGLIVPSYATSPKGAVGAKAKYTWSELVTVEDTEIEQSEKNPDQFSIIVTFRVHAQSSNEDGTVASPNTGRSFKQWWGFNPSAVAAGNTKDGQFIMSRITTDRMEQIVAAAGLPAPAPDQLGDVDYTPYFVADESGTKPLVGHDVLVRVVDAPDDRPGASHEDRKINVTKMVAPTHE